MMLNNDTLINALTWTLIHSLWQGMLIAAAGGMVLGLAKNIPARLRYIMFCSLLCIFVLATASTFSWKMHVLPVDIIIEHAQGQMGNGKNELFKDAFPMAAADVITDFINRNALWVMMAWCGLLFLKSFGVFRQMRQLQSLRKYSTAPVTDEWTKKINILKEKLDIKQAIIFLESGLATVPCTIGFLKPVILVPAGLLTSLPYDQVEAILLHELAHIRRRDYAVNLLQTLVETLFFFNPGVLWISALIREEREHCCDDLALSISQDKPSLVKALLSLSQAIPANTLSVAFPGRKNLVLKRVQRILGVKATMINQLEKSVLSVLILCFAIAVIACSSEKEEIAATQAAALEDLPKDFDAYDNELQKEMISRGIISDTTGMSYKLSNEDFIVNGALQSKETHQHFKAKYLKYKNMTATFYNWKFEE